jgi:tetratricopeptide (TPR) repeat protein
MRRIRMKFVISVVVLALCLLSEVSSGLEASRCGQTDALCKNFENHFQAGQFDNIIAQAAPAKRYSEDARHYIGMAYLALAGKEENTPEQEEAYCRKALEYGSTQAYMGLYFIHAQKDPEGALGFLRQYVETKPVDSVPYAILGEMELGKKNYKLADFYLRESKKFSRAHSARVDWMLFQTSYLLGDYQYAGEMIESAMINGKFNEELRSFGTDERFQGIEKRPEFRKYFIATNAHE